MLQANNDKQIDKYIRIETVFVLAVSCDLYIECNSLRIFFLLIIIFDPFHCLFFTCYIHIFVKQHNAVASEALTVTNYGGHRQPLLSNPRASTDPMNDTAVRTHQRTAGKAT